MICINYIKRIGDKHFFYTIWKEKIRTFSIDSEDYGPVKAKLEKQRSHIVLDLFELFLEKDLEFIDAGKDIHLYSELKGRIESYIEWAGTNMETMPESVSQNGLIATKYMRQMIEIISPNQKALEELIFIEHCASETAKVEFKEFE